MVDITYTDPVPARAQRIATAYADAVIAANLDKRFQANAYAKTFLEDQIKQLKLRLEESEKVLLDFAQREQIVAVTDKVQYRRKQSVGGLCDLRRSRLGANQERAAVETA